MTYDFSFDKKAVWALFAGSVVLGVLLFVAGLLVGGNLGEKSPAEQAKSDKSKDGALADGESAAAPGVRQAPALGQPVLLPEPLAPDAAAPVAAAPGLAAPNVAAPNMSAQGAAAQGWAAQGMAAPRVPSAAPAAPPAGDFGEEAPRRNTPVRDPDPKLVQEAETGAPGEAESPAPLKGLAYAVQVGDYQEEKGARRLAEELESKGYTPSIFSGRDAENRVWFAVRIGAYAGAKDASQAAANFTKQEKLKATVRPVNAF
jgi:hypothetical protein